MTTYEPLPQRPVHTSDSQDDAPFLSADDEQDVGLVSPHLSIHVPPQIQWVNFVLGAAVLLPWNAIITATPYFLSRLSGSAFQSTFSSYLSATFTISNFCFLAHATVTSKQSNFSRQVRRSLLGLTLLLFLLATSTLMHLPPTLFFFFVLLNGVCQAAAGSYLQSAVVAAASLFGPSVMLPVMSGQAAVGIFVSLVQVLSTSAGIHTGTTPNNSRNRDADPATRAAFLFFGLSTLFLVFTIVLHMWLISLPAYKAVVIPFETKKVVIGSEEEQESLVEDRRFQEHPPLKKGRILEITKMNVEFNFAIAFVFVVTLSIFPPITSSIRSVHTPSSSSFTHPLMFTALHFLIFNVGDFIGRYLPTISWFQIWSSRPLLFLSLSRVIFIPLFLLCNVQRPSSSPSPPPLAVTGGPLIKSDILFFIILLFFGLTNGWVANLIMMAAPSTEYNPRLRHRPYDVDTAATIAQFCLVGGLAVGSFTSFGVRGAICSCNPFIT